VSLSLRAYIQGPASSSASTVYQAAYANSDIIQSLNPAAPGGAFSPSAKLLLVTPSNVAASRFVVREVVAGTNQDTDVSGFFTNSVMAAVARLSPAGGGAVTGTQYALDRLVLEDGTFSLDLAGLATTTLPGGAATATLAGSGTVTNAVAVFQGTLTLSAGKIEPPPR
jgi:hypothetical protein